MTIHSDNSPGSRGRADYSARFVRIPMRDGVELGAILYLPLKGPSRLPTVMETTPYLADNLHNEAISFTRKGMAFLAVDCRGRGGSGSEFQQYAYDGPDGYDTIEWIACQSWSDGQVGLTGGSYTGWNQWMIAGTLPPSLKTIVPSAAYMPGIDLPRGGIGTPYSYRWRVTLKGHSISWNLAADTLLFNRIQGDLYAQHRSFLEVPDALGFHASGSEADLLNTTWGPVWEARNPTDAGLSKLEIPVLSLTGLYDTCLLGTLEHHRRFVALGSEVARANNYLIIGPWDHRGMDGCDQVYGLKFGPAAHLDIPQLKFEWYRWVFGLGDKPAFLDAPIKYYLTGHEEWRGADSLDSLCSKSRPLFLASNGKADDIFHSGWLADEAGNTSPDSFVSDPTDLRPLETETNISNSPELSSGGAALFPRSYNSLFYILGGEDPTNAVFCHNTYGQGVIYHTPPFDEAADVVGEPALDLWVTCDAPDADLAVLLYEVLEDGSVIFLSSSQLRMRHRDGGDETMPANKPVLLSFPRFRFVARRIARNSRLRLVVRATACSFMQKNLNSATPVSEQKPGEERVAKIQVLHDLAHPSLLRLPTGPEVAK